MGRYGKYHVLSDLHVVVGNTEVDLPAGEFSPASEDEYLACRQYVGVSVQPAGAESSEVLVEQLEGPDPDGGSQPAEEPAQAGGQEQGPEPAGGPGQAGTATTSPAGGGLAGAEAEEAKAQTDLKATAGDKPLYTFAGQGSPDPAEWPKTDLDTADGKALYTFAGDTAGGQPTGGSAEWVVYTGPVQAAS